VLLPDGADVLLNPPFGLGSRELMGNGDSHVGHGSSLISAALMAALMESKRRAVPLWQPTGNHPLAKPEQVVRWRE
jgi:hypothetical protein